MGTKYAQITAKFVEMTRKLVRITTQFVGITVTMFEGNIRSVIIKECILSFEINTILRAPPPSPLKIRAEYSPHTY
jgi:hypothetical protein